jgi:hypothetical protein
MALDQQIGMKRGGGWSLAQAWKQPTARHVRHGLAFAAIIGVALWLAPIPAIVMLVCGMLDVGRHRRLTYKLVEEYFTGKGLLTWLLSPINLCADILAQKAGSTTRIEDLPPGHRQEIETCVAAFVENRAAIQSYIGERLANEKRVMLSYKWFGSNAQLGLRIPAFEQDFRYVKTIAVSAFRGREQTSWHFGPQRLTFRVLRNLDPIEGKEVYLSVDDQTIYWDVQPLLIFDDTMFHRSVNGLDTLRCCLFMDLVRPSPAEGLFLGAIGVMNVIAGSVRRMFYRNWAFIR